MKKNLLLLLVTSLLLTFLSEVFIRFFFPQDLQRYWVTREPNYGLTVNKKIIPINYTGLSHLKPHINLENFIIELLWIIRKF